MRAAIYARISADRSGDLAGVDRQVTDCENLAAGKGYVIVARFVDNDVSAYSGRHRPEYEALLAAVRTGAVDVVVAYHVDRLYRRLRDLVPLLDLCERTGVAVVTVKAGDLDLGSASGRVVASILGAVAEGESARQAERIRREKLDRALAGKPNGSMRSYGYAANGSIVEAEAVIVRELAQRVLAGESLRSVTNDLNDRAIPTARGGLVWRGTTVRQLLMAARLSGQREHTPTTKGRSHSNGSIVAKGTWEPILTPDDTSRLRALLEDPKRKSTRPGRQLLTGVLRCSNCGYGMNSHADAKGQRYTCVKTPGSGKCGKRSITGLQSDEFVTAVFVEAIYGGGSPRRFLMPAPTGMSESAQREVDTITAKIKEMANRFANDEITETEFETWRLDLKQQRERLLQSSIALNPVAALSRLPDKADEFLAIFPTLSVDRRRAMLLAAFERVEVGPVRKPGWSGFDTDRLTFIWRDGL